MVSTFSLTGSFRIEVFQEEEIDVFFSTYHEHHTNHLDEKNECLGLVSSLRYRNPVDVLFILSTLVARSALGELMMAFSPKHPKMYHRIIHFISITVGSLFPPSELVPAFDGLVPGSVNETQ